MADHEPYGGKLLYDPLFETPPDTVIRDTPGRGFFGKAVVKKTIFVLVLLLFVGVSIMLSFSSLTKARFHYEQADGGMMLSEFNANKGDTVLEVGPVFSADGSSREAGTVVSVRRFAVCCNEYTSIILIGKDVADIPDAAFYSCTALQAVLVDADNPHFCSADGVLYRMQDGRPTELMLYPARNDLYRAMLSLGETAPETAQQAEAFVARSVSLQKKSEVWLASLDEDDADWTVVPAQAEQAAWMQSLRCEILPGVTQIGAMAFAECETLFDVTIPEGVRSFASMAFFKCRNLRSLRLPDSAETIGSDAFSYCEKVPYIYIPAGVRQIGHHAFYGCKNAPEVCMACAEDARPQLGQNWLPQYKRLFMHDVPVVWSAQRRADG